MKRITLKQLKSDHPLFKQGAIVGPFLGYNPNSKLTTAESGAGQGAEEHQGKSADNNNAEDTNLEAPSES